MQYRKNIILDFVLNLEYCVLFERQLSTMTTLEKLYYGNSAPHELTTILGVTDTKKEYHV